MIYEYTTKKKTLDFHEVFKSLINVCEVECLRSIYEGIYSFFKNAKIVSISELLNNKTLIFKSLIASLEIIKFVMSQLIDHTHSHVLSQNISEKIRYILVIDEAYYVLQSPLIELYVRSLKN